MSKHSASHSIRCPFRIFRHQDDSGRICNRKFTGRGESEHSQRDAENAAEAECYRKFNNHVLRSHKNYTS